MLENKEHYELHMWGWLVSFVLIGCDKQWKQRKSLLSLWGKVKGFESHSPNYGVWSSHAYIWWWEVDLTESKGEWVLFIYIHLPI